MISQLYLDENDVIFINIEGIKIFDLYILSIIFFDNIFKIRKFEIR